MSAELSRERLHMQHGRQTAAAQVTNMNMQRYGLHQYITTSNVKPTRALGCTAEAMSQSTVTDRNFSV